MGAHNGNKSGTCGITMTDDDAVGSSTLVDGASIDVDKVASVNPGKHTHTMMSSDSGVSLPDTSSVLTTMQSRGSITGRSNAGSDIGGSNVRDSNAGGSRAGGSKLGGLKGEHLKGGHLQVSRSMKREPRMISTAAVVGMQGSLNHLTDVIERTFASTEEPGVAA